MQCLRGLSNNSVRAALTLANRLKAGQMSRLDSENIAFLSLVTPNFQRTHTWLITGNFAQINLAAPAAILYQLGQGVAEPAGTNIVDKRNRAAFP